MDSPITFYIQAQSSLTCTFCLNEDHDNSLIPIRKFSQFLNLNFGKIFNITKGVEDNQVEILAALCTNCTELRNTFYNLSENQDLNAHGIEVCAQNIRQVMINADICKPPVAKFSRDIGNSLFQRFRQEVITQCSKRAHRLIYPSEDKLVPGSRSTQMPGISAPTRNMLTFNSRSMMQTSVSPTAEIPSRKAQNTFDRTDTGIAKLKQINNNGKLAKQSKFKDLCTKKSKKYTCYICKKVVSSPRNLESHLRVHEGIKPYVCGLCNGTFRDTSNLRSHALRCQRHLVFANFKSPEKTEKEFIDALQYVVSSIWEVVQGEQVCSPNRAPGICRLCGKTYKQGVVIEEHVVQNHYAIMGKTIEFLQNQMSPLSEEDLFQFMKRLQDDGTSNEIYKCGMCSEEFDSESLVNIHIKSHIKVEASSNKMYHQPVDKLPALIIRFKIKCKFCNGYFNKIEELKKHKAQCKNRGSGSNQSRKKT